jgi:hypothetical protein
MGYKILGFVVWNGGKWYLRSRARAAASPKGVAAGVVGLGIVALLVGGRRASSS